MARTFSNFLLFENLLDNLPEDSSTIMKQTISMLLTPVLPIVEEDCGTLMGKVVPTNFELEGFTSLLTEAPLTREDLTSLLEAGTYTTKIRTLDTCNSNTKGGVCRKCYAATYFQEAPPVGHETSLPTKVIYQSDVLLGTGYTDKFALSQTEDDWYDVVVIQNGEVVDPAQYYLDYQSITFYIPPPLNHSITVHFIKEDSEPLLGYISKSYAGGLLGIKPLETLPTIIRPTLYNSLLNDNYVDLLQKEVSSLREIPRTYIGYIDTIHDKLEKVLYILFIYALFKSLS